jgi:hypothetical protein
MLRSKLPWTCDWSSWEFSAIPARREANLAWDPPERNRVPYIFGMPGARFPRNWALRRPWELSSPFSWLLGKLLSTSAFSDFSPSGYCFHCRDVGKQAAYFNFVTVAVCDTRQIMDGMKRGIRSEEWDLRNLAPKKHRAENSKSPPERKGFRLESDLAKYLDDAHSFGCRSKCTVRRRWRYCRCSDGAKGAAQVVVHRIIEVRVVQYVEEVGA